MSRSTKYVVAISCLLLAGLDGTALAQEIPRGETVRSRPKPELEPHGSKVGGFTIFPKASITGSYNDNIMSSDSGEISDQIIELNANVNAKSNWKVNSIAVNGDIKVGRYLNSSNENYEDYKLKVDGRYDIGRNLKVVGGANVLLGHESRSSADDANGISPTQYSRTSINGEINKIFNNFSIGSGIVTREFNYKDVKTLVGTVNNDDRDRIESEVFFKGGYKFTPELKNFLKLKLNNRRYRDSIDDNGFNRDSKGYYLTTGLSFYLTGITFGNVFVGYRRQMFEDVKLKDADGASYGLDITWNATTITTVKGSVEETVEETTTVGASGVLRTKSTLSIDHELLRNMIISSNIKYTDNDYVGIDRKDKEFGLGFGVEYKLFRNFYVNFNYDFFQRRTNADNADYRQGIYSLRLSVQL